MSAKFNLVLSESRAKKLSSRLRVGENVYGKVLKKVEAQRFLVLLKQEEVIAFYTGEIAPGMLLKMKVESLLPHIQLKIMMDTNVAMDVERTVGEFSHLVKTSGERISIHPNFSMLLRELFDSFAALEKTNGFIRSFKTPMKRFSTYLNEISVAVEREEEVLQSIVDFIHQGQSTDDNELLEIASSFEQIIEERGAQFSDGLLSCLGQLLERLRNMIVYLQVEQSLPKQKHLQFHIPLLKEGVICGIHVYCMDEEGRVIIEIEEGVKRSFDCWVDAKSKSLQVKGVFPSPLEADKLSLTRIFSEMGWNLEWDESGDDSILNTFQSEWTQLTLVRRETLDLVI